MLSSTNATARERATTNTKEASTKPEMIPPEERSGRSTYANATWRDLQNRVCPWYGVRPDVDVFMIVDLHNHAYEKVTGAGNFRTRQAAQEWMEKTIAPSAARD
jgi:hypothetical protein